MSLRAFVLHVDLQWRDNEMTQRTQRVREVVKDVDLRVLAPSPEAALAYARKHWKHSMDFVTARVSEPAATSEEFGLESEWHLVTDDGTWVARLDVATDRAEQDLPPLPGQEWMS